MHTSSNRCFCVKNRRASCTVCCDCCTVCCDFAHYGVIEVKLKSCSGCNGQKMQPSHCMCQRLLTMVRCSSEQASLLLQMMALAAWLVPHAEKRIFCEKRVFTHDPVSPAWGYSMCSQLQANQGVAHSSAASWCLLRRNWQVGDFARDWI